VRARIQVSLSSVPSVPLVPSPGFGGFRLNRFPGGDRVISRVVLPRDLSWILNNHGLTPGGFETLSLVVILTADLACGMCLFSMRCRTKE
jgi:hypothetical protein